MATTSPTTTPAAGPTAGTRTGSGREFCNRFQNVCLAVALWNERDPILKERLFRPDRAQGNHGEDVKEYYFYLDATPTHSYMKMLYKYPQVRLPLRGAGGGERHAAIATIPEFELIDALPEAFASSAATSTSSSSTPRQATKTSSAASPPRTAATTPRPLHLLPHVWFRNYVVLGHTGDPARSCKRWRRRLPPRPHLSRSSIKHLWGERWWYARDGGARHALVPYQICCSPRTNQQRASSSKPNATPFVKDGIHRAVVDGRRLEAINPEARRFRRRPPPHSGASWRPVNQLVGPDRVCAPQAHGRAVWRHSTMTIAQRLAEEADAFYAGDPPEPVARPKTSGASSGRRWPACCGASSSTTTASSSGSDGDPGTGPPTARRSEKRAAQRSTGGTSTTSTVISMPDKWEYPWYRRLGSGLSHAAARTGRPRVGQAAADPDAAANGTCTPTAKFRHTNGTFSDVNPPVHAWAALACLQNRARRRHRPRRHGISWKK